jgi:subtilisin family serine protease
MNIKLSLCIGLGLLAGLTSAARIEPDLMRRLEAAGNPNQKFAVGFIMKEQARALDLDPAIPSLPKPERRARVGRVLMDFAEASQHDLLAELKAREAEGKVNGLNSLWIVNEVACFATRDVIYEVAGRADVSDILYDLIPVETGQASLPPRDVHEPNLDMIHAPGAWKQGYTGQGIVVGEVDTGIWYTHLDLRNRLWTSPAYPHPGFNYASHILFPSAVNPSPNDTTENIDYAIGHGTHIAGIVVADGSYGNGVHDTMGVAPGARILVCNSLVYFNSQPGETLLEQSILLGFQFCIRPPRDTLNGADVITTSLGLFSSNRPRYAVYRTMEENVMAAGLTHAIAAGSEGQGQVRCPAVCPPPWPNPANGVGGQSAVFTVAGYDPTWPPDPIGPTTIWDSIPPWYDYVNPPGLTDPDLVAPDVNIFSTYCQGDQAYTTMSGSSMATPEVAGCMALMLSKNPDLTPRELDSIIELYGVEDLGVPGKDNTYGAGLINCSLAVAYTPLPTVAAEEPSRQQASPVISVPTITRGVLELRADGGQRTAYRAELLDATGRSVAALHPGANDVSRLATGVYFVRSAVSGQRSALTKVVVAR